MKRKLLLFAACLSILSAFPISGYHVAVAEEMNRQGEQALVFDPQTKKYFIGGGSKFLLRPDANSGLVNGIQYSLDGSDYKPYAGALQFTSEGKHILKFRAVDPINNWSPVQVIEVFVDTTAPVTEATFEPGKFYKEAETTFVQRNSKITLAAQDNLSGVANLEYSWDMVTFTPYTEPVTVDKSGNLSLYFRATDRVGNVEVAKKLDIVSDGSAPFTTLSQDGTAKPVSIDGKGYVAASDSVAFRISAKDDGSKVKHVWYSVDGAPVAEYKAPIYFLSDGAHTLKYFSEDNVGNKEEAKLVSVFTISHAPITNATALGNMVNTGGVNYATKQFQLKLSAKDNAVGLERIEYRLNDEKDFHSYIEPIHFNQVGMFSVSYRAVDRAGNVEPAKTFNVNIEENAPETKIATAQPVVVRDGINYSPAPNVVTLNVENSEVGVAQTTVSVNDGPFTNYNGPITLSADHKVYKIAYKSMDKLGNEERPKSVTYHMLTTVPVVDLFIENGKNQAEQVRANYFDQQPNNDAARGTASEPAKFKKSGPKD